MNKPKLKPCVGSYADGTACGMCRKCDREVVSRAGDQVVSTLLLRGLVAELALVVIYMHVEGWIL
jgi:hypothetical protein